MINDPLSETHPVSTHADKNRRLDEAYAEIRRLRAALAAVQRHGPSGTPKTDATHHVLLRLAPKEPVYLVVEARKHPGESDDEHYGSVCYFHHEHTCPSNDFRAALCVGTASNPDPHGLLEVVDVGPLLPDHGGVIDDERFAAWITRATKDEPEIVGP